MIKWSEYVSQRLSKYSNNIEEMVAKLGSRSLKLVAVVASSTIAVAPGRHLVGTW